MKKKGLSLFMLCILSLGLFAGSGDVNNDGKINAADIQKIVNYIIGKPSQPFIMEEADCNNDGKVNVADIISIVNKIYSGESSTFSVERNTYYIPTDYGHLRIWASCPDNTPLTLTLADGTNLYPNYDENKEMYYWDYWVEYNNGWGDSNIRTEIWTINCGDMKEEITVNYTGLPFAKNGYREVCFSADETEYTIDTNLPDSKLNFSVEGIDWYYNEEGKPVVHFSKNETGQKRTVELGLSCGGFELGTWNSFDQLGQPFIHTAEEHMSALREFCDATDYKTWGKNTNWWSNDPLWTWDFSINHDKWSNYYWHINDHVVNLYFGGGQYTGVHGTLPASFEVIMDDIQGELDLTGCALYGKIPYNIRHNKNWEKYGWNIIQQLPWSGGGFDMEDINLRIDDVEVEDFVNGTISTTYEMLKKNKLTWVFNAGAVDMIDGISDERVNKYLDYCDKGFGIIVTVGGLWETPYDNYRNYVIGQQTINSLPKSIIWTKGFDKADIGSYGSMSVLDSEGNLLWYSLCDRDMPASFYINPVDSVCRKYLGEPTEHELYVSTHYESSDYSHDGEVLILQKASVGKGVDLVFLGDQYVDTLLVEGGQFEKDMQASMEYFFGIEPYKTLRNRFNVYAVKAVSPNGYDGTEHKFNYNNETVFEYASNVPGIDMDHVAITVVMYNPNYSFFISGETGMWESGASIAYINQGGPSEVICHEMGGHGLAKLLDEYVYSGYEENHTQEGASEEFREWITTSYHDKGWGMNVSATDNPEEVPWAHFLKDARYKDEIGIYQGAWFWPEELWRPSENSVMRESNYLWFNAPSREAIYKIVMQLSEGEDWAYDYETFVAFDAPMREAYKQARARSNVIYEQNIEKCRIEMRPPKIYKGSWRDAGISEMLEKPFNNTRIIDGGERVQKPYVMYKGEMIEVDKKDKSMLRAR